MDTPKIQTENQAEAAVSTTSCSKYVKDDNATFLENLKGQFDEFVNASMDEHKTCFKYTMDKVSFLNSSGTMQLSFDILWILAYLSCSLNYQLQN